MISMVPGYDKVPHFQGFGAATPAPAPGSQFWDLATPPSLGTTPVVTSGSQSGVHTVYNPPSQSTAYGIFVQARATGTSGVAAIGLQMQSENNTPSDQITDLVSTPQRSGTLGLDINYASMP